MTTSSDVATVHLEDESMDDLNTDLLEAADIKLQKNTYQREKQGKYRQQERALRVQLRNRIADLEAILLRAKRRGSLMLSWEDIALTMREEHDLAQVENSRLDQQVRHVRTLLHDMKRWVHATLSVCVSKPCQVDVAQFYTAATPRIPQTRVQQRYGFPSMFSTVTEDDLNVVFDDSGCYQFIRRHELFMQNSLDELRGVMQADIWQFMINYARLHSNFLSREFVEGNRIVYVGQQMHEDEAAPTIKLQRNRHVWYILQAIAPSVTKIRMLFVVSSSFSKWGQTPLDEEARGFWGLDLHGLDEDSMQRKFREHALAVCGPKHHQRHDQYLESLNSYLRTMRA
ncbi:hypothetical protein DYB34_003739 [Aphanomyces astaci]|uniref:BZIP domain-containing protein n=2 Tax=Aphanomyces astaci TaxID=112090 RepID=A0A3R7AWK0_APHAT|nr:hypothetical protein DYB34_003739 [Aphanomyces astaci]